MSNIEFDDWRPMTEAETILEYGEQSVEVGKCFKRLGDYGDHYYCQREKDVLHICKNSLINVLFANGLNNVGPVDEITYEEFEAAMKETIYSLEINKYWK